MKANTFLQVAQMILSKICEAQILENDAACVDTMFRKCQLLGHCDL